MGIPEAMHQAMKAFPPTQENKDAALAAAIDAGERFLIDGQQVIDANVRNKLQSAAVEVWNLYVRVSSSVLLPKEMREHLPLLYSQEHEKDPMVYVKFFHPNSHWTWYATEFDGLDLFFGWVYGDFPELGYFTLTELEEFKDQLGLGIERDEHFTPMRLSEVKQLHPEAPAMLLTPPQPIIVIFVDDEEEEQNGKN